MSQEPGMIRLIAHFLGGMIGVFHGRFDGIQAFFIRITMIISFVLSVKILIENKMDY